MFDQRLHDLKQWVREFVASTMATAVKIRPYTFSSASGTTDKVQGYQNDEEKYDLDGQRMWPFGVRSVPPAGVDSVWIAVGGRNRSTNAVIIGAESSKYGPSDLADGEVAFYNKVDGCVIRLNADGTISINGTTYSAPQWDSFASVLDTFLTTVGSITTVASLPQCATAINAIVTAANTLKTAMSNNNDYKSTKVKWG